ncbi:MAG TPA: hypothetical protein ENG69_01700 [Candidatus Korarchaeota archaeon]|nr:hypothetical protein [Candidatus Korarchaeota archaeon]
MSPRELLRDKVFLIALAINLTLVLIILLPPVISRGPGVDVQVEPKNVPLNGNATILIRFDRVPRSARLEILQGVDLKPVQTFQLSPEAGETTVTIVAEEGLYSVGLHVARVVTDFGGGEIHVDAPFSVVHGGELSVTARVAPEEIQVRSQVNETVNVSATIYVEVKNELGKPVEGALVWVSSIGEQVGMVSMSPDPAKTGPDGLAVIEWTMMIPSNLTESRNLTDPISILVGAPGHPVSEASVEIKVRIEQAQS